MDGTLIDSTPAVNRSWLRWAVEEGIDPSFRDGMHGRPARDIMTSLVLAVKVEEALARVSHLEMTDTEDITVLPGAVELVGSIPETRRAIVTSCSRGLAQVRLAASGFPAPRTVVTIDDTLRGKPNPDPFLEAAARLGVDPRRCIVVEDAPAGLAAAKAAGCATIAVVGTHSAEELDADLVVSTLDHISIEVTDEGLMIRVAHE
jgi:sugar-phosphatase